MSKKTYKRVNIGDLTMSNLRESNEGCAIKIVGLSKFYNTTRDPIEARNKLVVLIKTNEHNGRDYEEGITLNRKICESLYNFFMEQFSKDGKTEPSQLCERVLGAYSVDDFYDAVLELEGVGTKMAIFVTIAITTQPPSVVKHLANEVLEAVFESYSNNSIVVNSLGGPEKFRKTRGDDTSTMLPISNANELCKKACAEVLKNCSLKAGMLPTYNDLQREVVNRIEFSPDCSYVMSKKQFRLEQELVKLCKLEVDNYVSMEYAEEILKEESDGADVLNAGLDTYQYNAVKMVCEGKRKVYAITGKAGTGKSHDISALHRIFNGECVLTAYQNSACDVLSRRVGGYMFAGKPIKSIMSLSMTLDVNKKFAAEFSKVRLVIVDESSQIGTQHLYYVLNIIRHAHKEAKLVFVGDILQLPPVCTYGTPFAHLVIKNMCPVADLAQFHRTNGLGILKFCEQIRNASNNSVVTLNPGTDGVSFEEVPNDSLDELINSIAEDYANAGEDVNAMLVVAEDNNMCDYINEQVSKILYPEEEKDNTKAPLILIGKPVVSTVNKASAYNGSTAWKLSNGSRFIVKTLDDEYIGLIDRFGDYVRIPLKSIDKTTFRVAYAVTVHKSQGTEADSVRYVFKRNCDFANEFSTQKTLKYVAFSRAKKSIVLDEIYNPELQAPTNTLSLYLNDVNYGMMSF